jgi:hypothetical protein
MAKLVLTNAQVIVNGTDLSNWVETVTVNYLAETIDRTSMGDLTKIFMAGLKDWSMDITFFQDFAAGGPDATIFPLIGTIGTIEVRPVAAARSATNPAYQAASALFASNDPIAGSVGQAAKTKLAIKPASLLNRLIV